jgi:single-strand DNA-binding protein
VGRYEKEWARRKRRELRAALGGICAECGTNRRLEFDCKEPRGDTHHRYDTSQRMSFYRREHRDGNLQLLCSRCHSRKSAQEHPRNQSHSFHSFMAYLNKVILLGNLTRDPDLRHLPKGTPVCKFGLAVNRKYNTSDGEKQEEVLFIDVETFNRNAENCSQYLRKGGSVVVEGRLKLDQWEDKNSGDKRQKISVVGEMVQFLTRKADESAAPRSSSTPPPSTPSTPAPADGTDDVPF